MIPRWLISTLVLILVVLVAAVAVVQSGASLAAAVGDAAAAAVLWRVALGLGLLAALDALLLLICLGLAVGERPPPEE